jgi:hypothetical protein
MLGLVLPAHSVCRRSTGFLGATRAVRRGSTVLLIGFLEFLACLSGDPLSKLLGFFTSDGLLYRRKDLTLLRPELLLNEPLEFFDLRKKIVGLFRRTLKVGKLSFDLIALLQVGNEITCLVLLAQQWINQILDDLAVHFEPSFQLAKQSLAGLYGTRRGVSQLLEESSSFGMLSLDEVYDVHENFSPLSVTASARQVSRKRRAHAPATLPSSAKSFGRAGCAGCVSMTTATSTEAFQIKCCVAQTSIWQPSRDPAPVGHGHSIRVLQP